MKWDNEHKGHVLCSFLVLPFLSRPFTREVVIEIPLECWGNGRGRGVTVLPRCLRGAFVLKLSILIGNLARGDQRREQDIYGFSLLF
jgi:hypothetical protein